MGLIACLTWATLFLHQNTNLGWEFLLLGNVGILLITESISNGDGIKVAFYPLKFCFIYYTNLLYNTLYIPVFIFIYN